MTPPYVKVVHRATLTQPQGPLNPLGAKLTVPIRVEVYERKRGTWVAREITSGQKYTQVTDQMSAESAIARVMQLFKTTIEPWQMFRVAKNEQKDEILIVTTQGEVDQLKANPGLAKTAKTAAPAAKKKPDAPVVMAAGYIHVGAENGAVEGRPNMLATLCNLIVEQKKAVKYSMATKGHGLAITCPLCHQMIDEIQDQLEAEENKKHGQTTPSGAA